jgi:hypothetical protein
MWVGVDAALSLPGALAESTPLAGLPELGSDRFFALPSLALLGELGMNYIAFQAVLWIAAGFLLVVLVIRRRKRRQHRQS